MLPSIASAFGALASVFGTLLETIAPVLTPLFVALSAAIIELSPHLNDLVLALGTAFVNAIYALLPHLPTLVDLLIDIIDVVAANPELFLGLAAGLWAVVAVAPLVTSIFGVLSGILGALATPIGMVVAGLGLVVFAVFGTWAAIKFLDPEQFPGIARLGESFEGLGQAAEDGGGLISLVLTDLNDELELFGQNNSAAMQRAAEDWRIISDVINGYIQLLGHHMQFGVYLWTNLWMIFGGFIMNIVGIAFDWITNRISSGLEILSGLFTVANGVMSGDWEMMWEGLKTTADGGGRMLVGSWGEWGADLLATASGTNDDLVTDWDGAWKEMFHVVEDQRGPIVGSALATATDVQSQFKVEDMRATGSSYMDGARQGMDQGRGPVLTSAGTTAKMIPGYFPSSLLSGAGVGLMSGLASGIISGIGRYVAGAVSSVTRYIRENKGPISYDRVMLRPAGLAIMEGLANGLLAGRGQLHRALDVITRDIQGHDFGSPVLVGVGPNDWREGDSSAPGGEAKYHIEVKAETRGASAQDVADEVLHAARVIEYGGLYARRTA